MDMWTTLRYAPSCPHIHSPYYGFCRHHLHRKIQERSGLPSVTLSFDRTIAVR